MSQRFDTLCIIGFLMLRLQPRSPRTDTLFPDTTLFLSVPGGWGLGRFCHGRPSSLREAPLIRPAARASNRFARPGKDRRSPHHRGDVDGPSGAPQLDGAAAVARSGEADRGDAVPRFATADHTVDQSAQPRVPDAPLVGAVPLENGK